MLKLTQRKFAFTSSHYGSCGVWQGEHESHEPNWNGSYPFAFQESSFKSVTNICLTHKNGKELVLQNFFQIRF